MPKVGLMFNPFRKKQGFQEEQGGGEPYFPPDLERFRNKGGFEHEFPYQPDQPSILEVPERERKFKAFAREMKPPENIGWSMENPVERNPAERGIRENRHADNSDRLDMILQKLETIDLRLKVIEQKMERRPI